MSTLHDNTGRIQGLIEGISALPKDRYEDGLAEGLAAGQGEADALLNNTLTEYTNDRFTRINDYALYSRTALKTVSFPNATEAGLSALGNCTGLVSLDLPNVTTVGNSALSGCTGLKSIAGIPKLTAAGEYAFQNCTGLTELNLPSFVSLGYRCFQGCSGLVKVKFYNRLTFFNSRGFEGCTSLKIADMGGHYGSIANLTFTGCSALVALIIRADTGVLSISSTNVLEKTPIASGTGFVYVPRNWLSDTDATKDYRRATNWSTFAAQFRVLEDYTVDGTITGELDLEKIGVTL